MSTKNNGKKITHPPRTKSKTDPDQLVLPMTLPKRQRLPEDLPKTKVHRATQKESTQHERYMERLRRERGGDD